MKLDNAAGAKKLGKLKMPMKRKGLDLGELEEGSEPGMEDEGMLGDEELDAPKVEGESDSLTDLSDDDLLAEVKKRGLMAKLDKPDGDDGDNEYL